MKVILSPEAVERLEAQIAFLRDAEAFDAAERLRIRVMAFFRTILPTFPAPAVGSAMISGRCGCHGHGWSCGIESNMNVS